MLSDSTENAQTLPAIKPYSTQYILTPITKYVKNLFQVGIIEGKGYGLLKLETENQLSVTNHGITVKKGTFHIDVTPKSWTKNFRGLLHIGIPSYIEPVRTTSPAAHHWATGLALEPEQVQFFSHLIKTLTLSRSFPLGRT